MLAYLITIALFTFVLIVALDRRRSKSLFLLCAGAFGALFSGIAFFQGYSAAFLPLVLSVVLLILSGIARLLDRAPEQRPFLAVALGVITIIALLPISIFSMSANFADTEGEFLVGVKAAEVVDNSRGMAWNARNDGPRRILLRVWYPAASIEAGGNNRRVLAAHRKHTGELFDGLKMAPLKPISEALMDIKTNAYWDAPVAEGEFPLLVFSHGYFGPINSNAMQMEQLASHGYIVVALTHPGETSELVYEDGVHFPLSPNSTKAQYEILDGENGAALTSGKADMMFMLNWLVNDFEPGTIIAKRMHIWADDFRAVLDALERDEYVGDLSDVRRRMNFEQIGYFGMSAGAAAAPWACYQDERCKAVAALDVGGGVGDLRNKDIGKPALIIDVGVPYRLGGQDLYYEAHCDLGKTPDVYRLHFPDAGHWDMTDFSLSLTPIGKSILPNFAPFLGPINGHESVLVQSRLLDQFFDKHLVGDPDVDFPAAVLAETDVVEIATHETARAWFETQALVCSAD